MTGLIGTLIPSPTGLALKAAPYVAIGALSLLCWHFDARAVANANAVREQAASFRQAQADSDAAWSAKLTTQVQTYTQQQKDAQNEYLASLGDVRSSADRYIAAHRVQPAATQGGTVSPVAAAAKAAVAGIRKEVPADSVLVPTNDVQGCSVTTGYALALRDWALSVTH